MLKVDSCFKECEIEVLEASKKQLVHREYCEPIKQSIASDALRATMMTQMHMAQVSSAMTVTDLSRVRMLERTKALLINKMDK